LHSLPRHEPSGREGRARSQRSAEYPRVPRRGRCRRLHPRSRGFPLRDHALSPGSFGGSSLRAHSIFACDAEVQTRTRVERSPLILVARSSKHQFQAACAALPSALEGLRLGESVALEPIVRALARGAAVDVAGVGGSEGPARFLTAVLAELCVPSTYRPVTHFLERREATSRVLVVFSQGLSPNARLMLSRASEYACALLVTSASSVEGEEGTELRTKG